MSEITPGELTQNRADLADIYTERVSIVRITRPTSQTTGRYADTRTVVWTGNTNRKPASETRRDVINNVAGDVATALSYWEFSFPPGVPVKAGDRIEAIVSGRVYEVIGQLDKSIQLATYVYAQERTSGPQHG